MGEGGYIVLRLNLILQLIVGNNYLMGRVGGGCIVLLSEEPRGSFLPRSFWVSYSSLPPY